MTPQDFYSTLYGDAAQGWLAWFFLPSAVSQWFPVGKTPPTPKQEGDTYLTLGIQRAQLDAGHRGVLQDVIGIPGLWLDLDFTSEPGAHKTTAPLPPDADACLMLLDSAPHPPSLIVHSGHGLQAYWLFNEVWYFEDQAEHTRASQLVLGWQQWFRAAGGVQGWHIDSTANLDRVFRVPGTQNHKTKPRPVSVLATQPFRYEPDDFADYQADDWVQTHSASAQPLNPTSINILHLADLSDRMKYLILHGDTLRKYPSRSEAVFGAVRALQSIAVSDDAIAGILLDPAYALSEMPREKGQTWLATEIARCHAKPQPARPLFHQARTAQPDDSVTDPWRARLQVKKNGDPTMNLGNVGLILANHAHWQGRFWWDAWRAKPMIDDRAVDDKTILQIAQWLCVEEHMSVANPRPIEQCILGECQKQPRDPLQHWLNTLPPWDNEPRLDSWLSDIAEVAQTDLGMAISRLLPVSMVARAMQPGCLYRYVVILEGPENTGKSSLARALAGQEWYVELSGGLDTKEAHMLLQGAWVAEMAELDSLTRTEETRLKAFITLTEDSWIPKYSNFRTSSPRRTIFIGTTNDSSYLKGETGNTRFLPIETGKIRLDLFHPIREQLFAEALHVYHADPYRWWELAESAAIEAEEAREQRRTVNVYEESLAEWLLLREETSWQDIAENFLQLHRRSDWANKSLQMQIAAALKSQGFRNVVAKRQGRSQKVWVRVASTYAQGMR